ncbi:alcohol dehydrogenase catalytic domain-containing protein [Nocardioides pyridinolyticus]
MPDTRVGHTFGHEFIGVVHEVGSSVENLSVGDRVMVPFNIFCGTCFFCARGLYSNCHNVNPNATAVGGIYGYSHTCGGYDGGQAEYVRVPFADLGPGLIPDWMDDDDAVLCTDALPTATSEPSSATSSRATSSWCSAAVPSDCSRPGRAG